MAILERCCMNLQICQSCFLSGERIVARGPLVVKCYVLFHFLIFFSLNIYVNLRYIQLSLGNRVLLGEVAGSACHLFICGCFIVFMCHSLCC